MVSLYAPKDVFLEKDESGWYRPALDDKSMDDTKQILLQSRGMINTVKGIVDTGHAEDGSFI